MRFGRHVVIEPLGAGAMGAVYRARDEQLGREVAIKTIQRPGLTPLQKEMFQARFANEARAIAALSHPHVVNVFDVGVEDGTPFLVMELAQGQSLATRLDTGRLTPDQARALGEQIAGALEAAHARGIVHRDVKPANILEAAPGTWKLADFGVAHVPDSELTITGQFVGSPAYAAPEALERGQFGPASDVYGLGATLYRAVSGEPPFGTGGMLTVGALAATGRIRPVAEVCPGLPADLADAITRALARDPAQRPTAAGFRAALTGSPLPPPVATVTPVVIAAAPAATVPPRAAPDRRRRAWLIAGGVAVLLLVGILIGLGASDDSGPSRPGAPAPPGPGAGPTLTGFAPEGGSTRSGKQQERWNNAQDKLRKGKYREAAKQLEKLVDEFPDDAEARAQLEQIYAQGLDDERGPGEHGHPPDR
jgi:eukaryotic-like serine/threonine-protein kinase